MSQYKNKIIIGLFLIIVIIFYLPIQSYNQKFNLGDKTVTIIIKPGDSMNKVINQLIDNSVVNSKRVIKIASRLKSIDKKLIPGRYDFTGNNSIRTVLNKLQNGDFLLIKVTIPEGNTIWETARLLAGKLELDSATIHNLNSDTSFLKQVRLPYLEGYLFPETYFFPWGIDEVTVVTLILEQFNRLTVSVWSKNRPNDLTNEEIIIMASIIESETGIVDERRLVSSVYNNRLSIKMKLDADPTVIYGMGGLTRPLYRKDLTKDSPYNTYMHKGLPPTPINSPGLASIKAALDPKTTEYFYFVADKTGRHIFSKTINEHNRAVRKIRASD